MRQSAEGLLTMRSQSKKGSCRSNISTKDYVLLHFNMAGIRRNGCLWRPVTGAQDTTSSGHSELPSNTTVDGTAAQLLSATMATTYYIQLRSENNSLSDLESSPVKQSGY